MKNTINIYDFKKWFEDNRPNNFSYQGQNKLFEYLEEYEDSTGEQIEFDPIALCCEYTEYDDIQEFWDNYGKENYANLEEIAYNTELIEVGKTSFIIQNF